MARQLMMALLVGASALAAASIAQADSVGTRMDVTAVVVANCRVVVPALGFGYYDPLGANASQPADASSLLTVMCTRNTTATISFDSGLHGFAEGDRGMSGQGQERLRYQIYRDSARSQVWMTGAEAMRTLSKGVSQPDELTVFGRIPPRQEVEPGAYSDVLTATVDF